MRPCSGPSRASGARADARGIALARPVVARDRLGGALVIADAPQLLIDGLNAGARRWEGGTDGTIAELESRIARSSARWAARS